MAEETPQPKRNFRARQLDDVSEEAFLESVKAGSPNFAILVLAIGQWASRPKFREWTGPTWALEACKKYFAESGNGTRKISSVSKGSSGRPDDGRVLSLIADLLADPAVRQEFKQSDAPLSENLAMRIAIGNVQGIPRMKVAQSEINRIAYHWHIDKDRRLEAAYEARGRRSMARKGFLPE